MDGQLALAFARRRQPWTDEETTILLDIWLEKFNGINSYDLWHLYQSIATEISNRGFRKNAAQCRTRMKTLKRLFKQSRASRRIGGLVGKFYRKIKQVINLNKSSECFSLNVMYDNVETDGFDIVKSEIVSDGDSDQSFQNHESVSAVRDEYQKLVYRGSTSSPGDVWGYSSHCNQHLDSQIQQLLQSRSGQTAVNQSDFVETNHHNPNPDSGGNAMVHEQPTLSAKESDHQVLGAEILSSLDNGVTCNHIKDTCSSSSLYGQTGHDCNQRKDTNQILVMQNDSRETNPSPNLSVRPEQEMIDSVRSKMVMAKSWSNPVNESDARKRLDCGDPLQRESHFISSNKKPTSGRSDCPSARDNSSLNNLHLSQSQSCDFLNDQNHVENSLSFSSEANQNESTNNVSFAKSMLDNLYSLQRTLVSIVGQQAVLTEKLADTEKERLAVRLKEAEIELLKQENEKERMAMEERQRREDRDHQYKVMQLVIGGLGLTSSGREVANGSNIINEDK
ncbi:uncharacterized protein LOC121379154 isoform X1 [Gigantopelta aegis]|uniref:uncharacterized protein LOC121379154 isoform X1 n=1 Tax=Gigantopelta aegis TaxID=1735272 RepID=UPI001B88D716|nr:uncharacterized protein LOC121379154 isoform X1 [Gigantopelta aegis]